MTKRYGSYRRSGSEWLGDIPSHWKVSKFRHVFEESSELNGLTPVGPMLSISGYRGVEVKEYSSESLKRSDEMLENYRVVRKGQLAVNTMWLNYAGLGISEFEGHVSPAYRSYWIRREVEPRFIHHLLRSSIYVDAYTSELRGIRPNSLQMPRDVLMSWPVLLPPLEEQRAIADYLDRETAQIDRLIDLQMRLIQKLNDRSVVKVRELVTGRANPASQLKDSGIPWLGCIDSLYRLIRVRHLAKVGTGFGDTVDAVEKGIYPFYVRSQTPLTSNDFDFYGPAVLTAGDGAGVAKVFHLVADGKFKAHQRVYVLHSFEGISPAFFFHFFKVYFSEIALDGSAKSTVDSVRRHMITDMTIVVPSLEEQQRIVEQIETEEASALAIIRDAERLVILSQERRAAIITAAVTGQIDVSQGRAA